MDIEQVALKLQETTDRSLRNEGRIKKLEGEHDALHKLATSVSVMAEQIKTMNNSISTLTGDVEEMKNRPAKKWDSMGEKIAWLCISAALGYILATIGVVN